MRRLLQAAVFFAVILILPWSAVGAKSAGRRTSPPPAVLFDRAEKAYEALRASTAAQRQRQNYTRVLAAYRQVFEKHPASRQADQSLMRAGELFTLLFRWTGREGDINQAQNYYERLVQNSPGSALADDALLAIAYLYLDQFKDPAQAWLRFREVTVQSPKGDRTGEAKRQLKRLARYATAEKPNPAAAPPPPVIKMPAPATISMPRARDQLLTNQPAAPATSGAPPVLNRVLDIRHWSNPEYSRVVIDLDRKTNFYSNLLGDRPGADTPPRLYIDLFGTLIEDRICKPISVNDGILHGIRAGQYTPDTVRVVLDIDGLRTYRIFPMENPFRIVVDVTGGDPSETAGTPPVATIKGTEPAPGQDAPAAAAPPTTLSARLTPISASLAYTPEPVPELIPLPMLRTPGAPPAPAAAARPQSPPASPVSAPPPVTFSGTAADATRTVAAAVVPKPTVAARSPAAPGTSGKPSLARQLGLGVRRVVIDAGHGAHDPGAIGIDGLQEKDVTLDLALRVRAILEAAGYEAVLTRDKDVYLPLEERTAIANTARGDLFLSLHCNSSDAGNLSGVETYYLNLASSERSMRTAARENSMAVANMSDLQQIVREIQNSKMDESSQFASRVQRSLHDALHRSYPDVKDLGVKQAPFYVLIGAQMPSILAEVSFINHRKDGRRLAQPAYRTLIAQAIADGVKRYVRTVKSAALAPGETTR